MTFQTEIEIDNNVLITGDVEFCGERSLVWNFALVVWIDGLDYNLSSGLTTKQREYFEEKLRNKASKAKESHE